MLGFIDYLVGNWTVSGCVGVEKRFSHVKKSKIDKKSDKEVVEHVLTIGLKFFDKDNNLLRSESIKFVNNVLNGSDKKNKLINISGDELENKFMFAKEEILNVINTEYRGKIDEINSKMSDLMSYYDRDGVAINKEFKGERIDIVPNDAGKKKTMRTKGTNKKEIKIEKLGVDVKKTNKKQFDM